MVACHSIPTVLCMATHQARHQGVPLEKLDDTGKPCRILHEGYTCCIHVLVGHVTASQHEWATHEPGIRIRYLGFCKKSLRELQQRTSYLCSDLPTHSQLHIHRTWSLAVLTPYTVTGSGYTVDDHRQSDGQT